MSSKMRKKNEQKGYVPVSSSRAKQLLALDPGSRQPGHNALLPQLAMQVNPYTLPTPKTNFKSFNNAQKMVQKC